MGDHLMNQVAHLLTVVSGDLLTCEALVQIPTDSEQRGAYNDYSQRNQAKRRRLIAVTSHRQRAGAVGYRDVDRRAGHCRAARE